MSEGERLYRRWCRCFAVGFQPPDWDRLTDVERRRWEGLVVSLRREPVKQNVSRNDSP